VRAAVARRAVAPRVLWIEGPTPSLGGEAASARLGVPKLAPEDARIAYAFALAPDARGVARDAESDGESALRDLPTLRWPAGQALPPAGDPRWSERALVSAGPRARDLLLVIRRDALARLASWSALAAELEAALAAFTAIERRWRFRGRELALSRARPAVMAVINVTPDSFSDGGRWNPVAAVARGEELAAAGASLLDIGGESTRPGSLPVPAELELERVLPVIERLARRVDVPISVDTTKAAVAQAALAAGAVIVNDTSALADDPAMAPLLASSRAGGADSSCAGVVLMHRRGAPRTMQDDPRYEHCVAEVAEELAARADAAIAAGIDRAAIVLDPGLGFGKRLEDNLDLVAGAASLRSLGFPLLLGASRKGFLGALTGRAASGRDAATLATTALAFLGGCELVRVHDAAGSLDVLRVLAAVRGAERAS
jgi:dihydropteroate synthase